MKKNETLYLSKSVYKIYGIKSFKVIDIVKEDENGICIFIENNQKSVWIPKDHIYRTKPNYLK